MGQRPPGLKPPAHLARTTPVPPPAPAQPRAPDPRDRDPTRYGDWELKGVAVDF